MQGQRGILCWNRKITPKSKVDITLHYKIVWPKDISIRL